MRTTTAEPTDEGVEWYVEKDITVYADYIRSTEGLYAYVAIPNNIDDTYTGIIQIQANITFYTSSATFPPVPTAIVQPLTSASSAMNPFDEMTVMGNESLSYSISIADRYVEALFVDIYASAHGCEEFYYTNVPTDSEEASSLGICGSGVYREIQVFIDGRFAGSSIPFPVVYTGGINPFLWRPLTGIMSFDIPSRRLDISPFLSVLTDGENHTISLTVLNNGESGYWYLDASLLYSKSNGARKLIGGEVVESLDSGLELTTQTMVNRTASNVCFHTTGNHSFRFSGILRYDDNALIHTSVSAELYIHNENCIIGSSLMKTAQLSLESVDVLTKEADGLSVSEKTVSRFPLAVESYYKQDESTMDMQATILYSYGRDKSWTVTDGTTGSTNMMTVSWLNNMASNATYNRTLDHTTVYLELGKAKERYQVSQVPWNSCRNPENHENLCYSRLDSASDGYIRRDSSHGICILPSTMSFCGYDICGSIKVSGYQLYEPRPSNCLKDISPQILNSSTLNDVRYSRTSFAFPPVVRHPLFGSFSDNELL